MLTFKNNSDEAWITLHTSAQALVPCWSPKFHRLQLRQSDRESAVTKEGKCIFRCVQMPSDAFILSLPNQERNSGSGLQQNPKHTQIHTHTHTILNQKEISHYSLQVFGKGNAQLFYCNNIVKFQMSNMGIQLGIIFISQPHYK